MDTRQLIVQTDAHYASAPMYPREVQGSRYYGLATAESQWVATAEYTDRLHAMLAQRYCFVPCQGQPYKSAMEMADDARMHGRILVTTDHSNHPIWSTERNWRFRGVHDMLGHVLAFGVPEFSVLGELQATGEQARWYPLELAPVLACEVFAQAAYQSLHGVFGEQKLVILPDDLLERILT